MDHLIAYAESNGCRRRILLDHFGDGSPGEALLCCDNCEARAAHQPESRIGDVASLSRAERTALIILDATRRLRRPVGRTKLAQILKGSRARDLREYGYDRAPYYGRLAVFSLREIEHLIEQLVGQGHLKVVGGSFPIVRLTARGERALEARTPIALHLPRIVSAEEIARKQAEREAGGTVAATERLFHQGLTPSEIAEQRGLAESTIYYHLAQLIGTGALPLSRVVPGDVADRVRAVLIELGDDKEMAALKARLPDTISYGQIACVVAAWRWERQSASGDDADQPRDAPGERVRRVVQLGETRSRSALPDLIRALDDPDGNVRRLAAAALGKIRDRSAVEPLVALPARETKPQVRQYAVKALGRIGDPRARELLARIAEDPNEREYTQAAARHALGRLSSHDSAESAIRTFLARPLPRQLSSPGTFPQPVRRRRVEPQPGRGARPPAEVPE